MTNLYGHMAPIELIGSHLLRVLLKLAQLSAQLQVELLQLAERLLLIPVGVQVLEVGVLAQLVVASAVGEVEGGLGEVLGGVGARLGHQVDLLVAEQGGEHLLRQAQVARLLAQTRELQPRLDVLLLGQHDGPD